MDQLSPDEHRWAAEREALWRRALVIVADHPGVDPSGVFHVLCNLERAPEERLRRALGRLRPDRA